MNARLRDKHAAYLAAMGREPEAEDPRGPNVVELRPPGTADSDEVTITYAKGAGVTIVRGKTTRAILTDLAAALGREPRQLIATPTKQGGFDSAWIKATDGPDVGAKLAFVTGLTPTQINIVWGRPIDRVEQVPGTQKNFSRFLPMGSSQARDAKSAAASAAGEAPAVADEPEPEPEPEAIDDETPIETGDDDQ